MASCSSSSTANKSKHDVFLSFRGEDTRDNFISHLYAALSLKKIDTFIDDQLRRGDEISPTLLEAIERSKIAVVVFSKNYASSRWCLEELVKILECKSRYGRVVIPVFYQVDPSHVRNQKRSYADAFAKVEERYEGEQEMLWKWRKALREAANLSGFDSNVIRPESKLVQDIVEDIFMRLTEESPSIDNKNLVGIASRVKDIEELLCIGFPGILKIGIWGIGGIGKTTLAGTVFNKVSRHFEGSYFIRNIREESEKINGLFDLRQKLVSTILDDKDPNLGFTFTTKGLGRKIVLIVFDDVTNSKQIETLIGDSNYLGSRSRIIVTTRDKKVLENCGVEYVYKTERLSDEAALQLFSQHAFRQSHPTKDFMQLSSSISLSAEGVPLALEVLGSFLFKRTKEEWISEMNRLKQIPHRDIQKVLKVSYDGLNDEEQSIFLDIACFFKGRNRDSITKILDAFGFNTHIGIQVLIEKSLITSSLNTITMHDLLQEMGREIVRQESIHDPSKRSRLWHHKDIYSVLTKNTGTGTILGIQLDIAQIRELHLNPKAFSGMYNLRFLKVYNSSFEDDDKVYGFEVVESDFRELRYFCWHGYSGKSLPPNFHPYNLVALDMQCSKVEELSLGVQNLDYLKHINLGKSKHLRRILGLSQAPNLESLILEDCTSLVESFSSFRILNKLVILNLGGCKSINTSLPIGIHWKFLRMLKFSHQSNLENLPYIPCDVEELHLSGTTIEELPSIEHPSRLVRLELERCSRLKSLSNDISKLESLRLLNLSGCSNLNMVPKISSKRMTQLFLNGTAIKELPLFEYPSSLIRLHLTECSRLESLPECIDQFNSLQLFDLSGCSKLDRLPNRLGNLKALWKFTANKIAIREVPPSILCLKKLNTVSLRECTIQEPLSFPLQIHWAVLDLRDSCINELPNNIGHLHLLRSLLLSGNNFKSLPASIKGLSNLFVLTLDNCKRLQSLPELPHKLKYIDVDGCTSLEALSGLPKEYLSMQRQHEFFNLSNCLKVDINAVIMDALMKIQRNAIIWFHSPKATRLATRPNACIYFPGSEVPEWFSCKSSRSFVELPAGWLKHNLVGFAVCVVLTSISNNHKANFWKVKIHLYINNVNISVGSFKHMYFKPFYLKSDHIFIGYDYCIMNIDKLHTVSSNSDGFIQFEVRDLYDETTENVKVKQCGVRLLYTEDYLRTNRDAKMEIGKRLDSMNPSVRRCEGCLICGEVCFGTDERTDNGKRVEFPHREVSMKLQNG